MVKESIVVFVVVEIAFVTCRNKHLPNPGPLEIFPYTGRCGKFQCWTFQYYTQKKCGLYWHYHKNVNERTNHVWVTLFNWPMRILKASDVKGESRELAEPMLLLIRFQGHTKIAFWKIICKPKSQRGIYLKLSPVSSALCKQEVETVFTSCIYKAFIYNDFTIRERVMSPINKSLR